MISTFFKWAEKSSLVAVWAGGAMIIFAAVMVTIDALIRKLFNVTLGGADEISGYLFAISTAWALPYTLLHRANVRIDALYMLLPPFLRAPMDLFGILLLAFFSWMLTWRAVALLIDSYETHALSVTPLHVPQILPQSFWLAGWVLFSACLLLIIVAVIGALFKGDLKRVNELAGALTLEDEIKEEGIDLPDQSQSGDKV